MPDFSQPFIITRVNGTLLGIPSSWATEMIVCPPTAALPLVPAYIRGIAMRRARPVTLVDTRLRLGMESRQAETQELIALLHAREADHVRWVETLVHSITDGSTFPLARDPHSCAFGQWYDHYQAPTLTLRQQLARFADPHARVHQLANEVEAIAAERGMEAALARIAAVKGGAFLEMRQLFEESRQLIQTDMREIAIVHDTGITLLGIVVDGIESVERLRPETCDAFAERFAVDDQALMRWSARTAKDAVVILPETEALLGELLVGHAERDHRPPLAALSA